jgi:FkbM family methyltransferase
MPLAQRALSRVRRAILREKTLLTTYEGHSFAYPSGSLIGKYVSEGKGWDRILGPILTGLVPRPDPTIVEVGSNIGAGILQFKIAKPDAKVYAYEPSPRFLPFLRQNIESNNWSDVDLRKSIVSSEVGDAVLHSNATTASVVSKHYDYHTYMGSSRSEKVTLDNSFGDEFKVDFLKVDTDGHDFDVLRGGQGLLERDKPVIFTEFEPRLLVEAGHNAADYVNFILASGYQRFLVLSNFGEALAVCSTADEVMALAAQHTYLDLVAVANPDQVPVLESLCKEIGTAYSVR